MNGAQWKSLSANVKKFPFAGQIDSKLKASIQKQGFDYDRDLKPLLGSDFVVGSPTPGGFLNSNGEFVGAVEVKDKGKLESLLSKSKGLQKDGSSNGATLYKQNDGGEAAQKDAVLLVADNRQHLVAALEQRDRDDRLTEDAFNNSLSGLSSNALVRGYVDVQSLINSSPGTAQARRIKWVAALRTVGITASSQSDGTSFDFNAQTDSSQVTETDLPIASGDESPPVAAKPGEIGLGIRGSSQIVRFAESVAQTVSPARYGDFEKAKKQINSRLGIDVDRDLVGQLSGNTAMAFDVRGHLAVRAEPRDPAAFAKTLAKFSKVAPSFAQGAGLGGARLTKARGLYKLTGRDGKSIYYGMVGKVFVASDDIGRLGQIASESPQPVPGAKGAIALNSDAGKLIEQIVSQAAGGGLGGALGGSIASAPLGDLTGWASASTSGITGHLKLEIR